MLDCRLLYGVIPQNKVSPPPGVGTLFEFNHLSLRSLVIVEFVTGGKVGLVVGLWVGLGALGGQVPAYPIVGREELGCK